VIYHAASFLEMEKYTCQLKIFVLRESSCAFLEKPIHPSEVKTHTFPEKAIHPSVEVKTCD